VIGRATRGEYARTDIRPAPLRSTCCGRQCRCWSQPAAGLRACAAHRASTTNGRARQSAGGRREAEDPDLLTTALRETEEEIGLDRSLVEVLATLPVIETIATGFRVAPFLGRLQGPPPTWRRQETEIDEILEVPLEDLLHPAAHAVEIWQLPGWPEPREILRVLNATPRG